MARPRMRRVRLPSFVIDERDARWADFFPELWAEGRRFAYGGAVGEADAGDFMTRWCGSEVASAWSQLPPRQRWTMVRIVAAEGVARLREGREPLAVDWFGYDGVPGKGCFVVFRDGVPSPVVAGGACAPDAF